MFEGSSTGLHLKKQNQKMLLAKSASIRPRMNPPRSGSVIIDFLFDTITLFWSSNLGLFGWIPLSGCVQTIDPYLEPGGAIFWSRAQSAQRLQSNTHLEAPYGGIIYSVYFFKSHPVVEDDTHKVRRVHK